MQTRSLRSLIHRGRTHRWQLLQVPRDRSRDAKHQWIQQLSRTWLDVVDPWDADEYPFTPAPALEPCHLERCRVLVDREALIREHLPKDGVVAEVGTLHGFNARTILEAARPRELHLIDADLRPLDRAPFEDAISAGTVQLHEGDSAGTLASFPDDYFDWIYIDGDHTCAGVVRDIEQAKRKVKPGGLLVFNDYTFFSHAELLAYGVVQAVNELCVTDGWEFRYLALHPQMYCDVAVARLRPAA